MHLWLMSIVWPSLCSVCAGLYPRFVDEMEPQLSFQEQLSQKQMMDLYDKLGSWVSQPHTRHG